MTVTMINLVHIAYVALVIVIIAILYLAYVIYTEWYRVQAYEKQDIFLCDIHGDILKKDLIMFMDQECCPRCWYDRFMTAKKES